MAFDHHVTVKIDRGETMMRCRFVDATFPRDAVTNEYPESKKQRRRLRLIFATKKGSK